MPFYTLCVLFFSYKGVSEKRNLIVFHESEFVNQFSSLMELSHSGIESENGCAVYRTGV